jgi:two-component system CheB/CheR fusion protein
MNAARRFPIVGIGASSGGVEALQVLFHAMPQPPPAMAFIVVTHVGPDHESSLSTILHACTSMPFVVAQDGTVPQPGHVYVLPNDALITIANGRLALLPQRTGQHRERQPIDLFFASLAEDQGEWAVGMVLSGSGSDGTLGLKAIKQAGGLTLAQGSDGTVPRFPAIPASAVASGVVDLVLPVQDAPPGSSPSALAWAALRQPWTTEIRPNAPPPRGQRYAIWCASASATTFPATRKRPSFVACIGGCW